MEYCAFIMANLLFLNIIFFTQINIGQSQTASQARDNFVNRLFKKYGSDKSNKTTMETKRFTDLMKSLALGKVEVICQRNDTECYKDKYAGHDQAKKDPLLSRKRRGVDSKTSSSLNKTAHERDWNKHLAKCMTVKNVTTLYNVKSNTITKPDFINICPSLIHQIDSEACVHYHKRFPELKHPEGPPTASESWGYGFLAVTICSLLTLCVIAIIPCLQKSFYNMLMAYLVALAVGTLAGDAMLHLIPHAFIEGANLAAGITVSKEQRERQHYAQVWRAMFVLAGVYLFFVVEQIMKLKGTCGGGGDGHGHSHEVPLDDPTADHAIEANKEVDGGGHGHSHGGDKAITGQTNISSVAWMVIVGDGFHNFSDGLAVGAAFSASISSGVSTTIAIFCHELPHELGDFAILLKAGMTVKQAIVYNLVSAVLAYIGLAIGILAGESELGRHVILCLTAGLFLYISLVSMMGELTDYSGITSSRLCTIVCQHLGLLSGFGIMLIISIYEHDM